METAARRFVTIARAPSRSPSTTCVTAPVATSVRRHPQPRARKRCAASALDEHAASDGRNQQSNELHAAEGSVGSCSQAEAVPVASNHTLRSDALASSVSSAEAQRIGPDQLQSASASPTFLHHAALLTRDDSVTDVSLRTYRINAIDTAPPLHHHTLVAYAPGGTGDSSALTLVASHSSILGEALARPQSAAPPPSWHDQASSPGMPRAAQMPKPDPTTFYRDRAPADHGYGYEPSYLPPQQGREALPYDPRYSAYPAPPPPLPPPRFAPPDAAPRRVQQTYRPTDALQLYADTPYPTRPDQPPPPAQNPYIWPPTYAIPPPPSAVPPAVNAPPAAPGSTRGRVDLARPHVYYYPRDGEDEDAIAAVAELSSGNAPPPAPTPQQQQQPRGARSKGGKEVDITRPHVYYYPDDDGDDNKAAPPPPKPGNNRSYLVPGNVNDEDGAYQSPPQARRSAAPQQPAPQPYYYRGNEAGSSGAGPPGNGYSSDRYSARNPYDYEPPPTGRRSAPPASSRDQYDPYDSYGSWGPPPPRRAAPGNAADDAYDWRGSAYPEQQAPQYSRQGGGRSQRGNEGWDGYQDDTPPRGRSAAPGPSPRYPAIDEADPASYWSPRSDPRYSGDRDPYAQGGRGPPPGGATWRSADSAEAGGGCYTAGDRGCYSTPYGDPRAAGPRGPQQSYQGPPPSRGAPPPPPPPPRSLRDDPYRAYEPRYPGITDDYLSSSSPADILGPSGAKKALDQYKVVLGTLPQRHAALESTSGRRCEDALLLACAHEGGAIAQGASGALLCCVLAATLLMTTLRVSTEQYSRR